MVTKSYNNFSGGYTRENAEITEKICQFVTGSKNIDIVAKQDDGYGFQTMQGNSLYCSIAGKSIYNLWTYDNGDDNNDYLVAHTGDTVQIYNESTDTFSVLKSGLTVTATTASFQSLEITTVGVGTRHLGFFTNGVDKPFIYEKGQTPEVQDVTAVGIDGKTIRGHIAIAFDGRIWIADGANLYRSVQLDPFTFSTAESAGLTQYGSKIMAITRAFNGLLVSTGNGFEFIKPNGDGTYSFEPLSTNYALNHQCLSTFGKSALFYAQDGVYPVDTTQAGVSQTGNNLSYEIDAELSSYALSIRQNAQMVEVVVNGRNETWLHLPVDDSSSVIYILRWKKGNQKFSYWLPPRYQQKINCLHVFKNKILSGTSDGKILEEMAGNTYNGNYYESVVVLPKITFGNYSGKIKTRPIIFIDNEKDNNFYLDYILNGNSNTIQEKYIETTSYLSGIWADSEDDANGSVFSTDESDVNGGIWAEIILNRINMERVKSQSTEYECSLQFRFTTKSIGNSYSVHCIDLTDIEKG